MSLLGPDLHRGEIVKIRGTIGPNMKVTSVGSLIRTKWRWNGKVNKSDWYPHQIEKIKQEKAA